MDQFIVKAIPRSKAEKTIPTLQKAYSEKLGVNISQADAIGLALENEFKRVTDAEDRA